MTQNTSQSLTNQIDTYVFNCMKMGQISKREAVRICKQYHPNWFEQLAAFPEAQTNPYVKCKY